MCIEQRKAFEAVMECVDAQAAEVEKGEKKLIGKCQI